MKYTLFPRLTREDSSGRQCADEHDVCSTTSAGPGHPDDESNIIELHILSRAISLLGRVGRALASPF